MDKEYYIEQIEKVGEYLKSRANLIFLDIKEPISNVNIQIDIYPAEPAKIQINKSYIPDYISSNRKEGK